MPSSAAWRRWRVLPPFPTRRFSDLTAKGDEVDRVIGLEMGADDYLPKPFGSRTDRKSTRLNSSHLGISYAVFCCVAALARPPPFPYTTLFRSHRQGRRGRPRDRTGNGCRRLSTQAVRQPNRSEEHTSELQSLRHLVCRLLLRGGAGASSPLSLHDAFPISPPRATRSTA